jgi:alpha-galactosidase
MSARFGFDLDPRGLTDDERTACVQAVETYRQIRPLVQFGDLHRLVSPVGSPRGALAFLAPEAAAAADRDQPCAVAFAHLLEPDDAPAAPPLTVPGLDPERRYVVVDATPGDPARGTTRQVLGRDLAGPASGLGWPEASAQAAKVWTIWPEG